MLRRPDKVAGAVLIEPIMVFADLTAAAIVRSIPAGVRWFPQGLADDFASWTANDAPVEDEPVARMNEAGMQTYAVKLGAPRRPAEERLAAVSTPMMVLLAEESRMHDSDEAATTARRVLPDADVRVYPDASHAINGEFGDRIAADVASFVSRPATPAG